MSVENSGKPYAFLLLSGDPRDGKVELRKYLIAEGKNPDDYTFKLYNKLPLALREDDPEFAKFVEAEAKAQEQTLLVHTAERKSDGGDDNGT